MRTLTISNTPHPAVSMLDQRKLEFLLDGKSIAILKPNESAAASISNGSHTIEVRLRNMFGEKALGSVTANEKIVSGSKDVCVEATSYYGKMRMRLHVLATVYPSVVAVPDYRLEQVISQAAVEAVQSDDFKKFFNDRRNSQKSVEVRCSGTGMMFAINNSEAKLLSELANDGHNLRMFCSFAASGFYLTAEHQNDKNLIHQLTETAVNAIIANTKFKKDSYHFGRITTR